MFLGGWLSLWKYPSVWVSWHWGSFYGLPIPLETLNSLPKRHPGLCPMLGYGCLHLILSGAGWTLSEDKYAKVLSGSIRKYFLSNVRDWWLSMGWVSIWAGCLAIPSFSAPSFCLHFLYTGQFWGGKVFGLVGVIHSPLGALPFCRMWLSSLSVTHCYASKLLSTP